jgi:hypothetical protein
MTGDSLSAARVAAVNRGLPRIQSNVRALTIHIRFLQSIGRGGSIDGRELLRCVSDAQVRAAELRHSLQSLAEQAASIRRRSLGQGAYGQFQGNLEGSLRHLSCDFAELETAIRDLNRVARESLNGPGRWGDAAAAAPVNDLFGLLATLLEIWRLERIRNKLG